MEIRLNILAGLVNGEILGDDQKVIRGIATLQEANESDISFLGNNRYWKEFQNTRAGAVLVSTEVTLADAPQGTVLVRVSNPQLALAKLLNHFLTEEGREKQLSWGIHPTAQIAPTARISEAVSIGAFVVVEDRAVVKRGVRLLPFCYLGPDSFIDEGSLLYPGVFIGERVRVGKRVIVHSGSVLGSDGFGFVPEERGLLKIPQIGTVDIGDDVEIGANVTVDRATLGKTVIGRGSKIDNLVQIAHNVVIGDNSIIVAQAGIAGSTELGAGVTVAGQAGIAGHLKIGDGSRIAAQAGVIGDVYSGQTVSGYPARPHRSALKIQAYIQRLPDLFSRLEKMAEFLGRHFPDIETKRRNSRRRLSASGRERKRK